MFIHFLIDKLPALFLIAGLAMILSRRRKTENANLHYLWLVIVSAGILAVAEYLERQVVGIPSLITTRIVLSIIGYCMRSQCVLGLLLTVATGKRTRRRLWIPQILLTGIMTAALFTPLVFSYDDQGGFHRGPLSYIAFIVPAFYIICLLWQVIRRFRDNSVREAWLLVLCLVFGVVETTIEVFWSGGNLETILLISSLLFFVFSRFQDIDRDTLTGLKNRRVYYEEREHYNDIITAVAFIDLNGLKRINDVIGHDEGDRALSLVGDALHSVTSKDTHAFRVGGDEFVLLFFAPTEAYVRRVLAEVRQDVHSKGLSIAAGYAVRSGDESVHDLAHIADKQMYADKAAYYQDRQYDHRK